VAGYIDIHTHLLPEVDDGVKTVEDSLECLRAAEDAGFSDIVLSRHQIAQYYVVPAEEADQRRERLKEAVEAAGLKITLHNGAEHYMDDMLIERLETGAESLAGRRALLVEMPMMHIPPFVTELAFRIRLKGLVPILAHVERYREIVEDPKKAASLADAGYLLQVNLGSVAGFYGRHVAKTAKHLIERNLVFCVASDCHGPKMVEPAYKDGIRELKKFGEKTAETLLGNNPGKIFTGEDL
jgi:protein-tyrosine phosphatase